MVWFGSVRFNLIQFITNGGKSNLLYPSGRYPIGNLRFLVPFFRKKKPFQHSYTVCTFHIGCIFDLVGKKWVAWFYRKIECCFSNKWLASESYMNTIWNCGMLSEGWDRYHYECFPFVYRCWLNDDCSTDCASISTIDLNAIQITAAHNKTTLKSSVTNGKGSVHVHVWCFSDFFAQRLAG